MYNPPSINGILNFPTGKQNQHIKLPKNEEIEIGDILVARYNFSRWTRWLPWENWHHVAIVSKINPLTIIEAVGHNAEKQWEGPTEVGFWESVGFGKAKDIKEIRWLRPIFPNPLREIDSWHVQRSKRKIITSKEARKRVITYVCKQLNEPYSPIASKWNENAWYCSLLIYKSYSRTITGMYLENYDDIRAGYLVTPEDLLDCKKTEEYFSWKYENNTQIEI
ncbi:MAG: hypothetical protein Q8P68_06150 [Candidatus Peregrinibacteria bacterium]|nr:hypothetical protein [Candidatus Peregrinibacteria bacterium]